MARNNEMTKLGEVAIVMEVTGTLKGKSFSITGHLGKPRDEIVEIIQTAGGHYHKTPGRYTNYLITNQDWNAGSTAGSTSNKFWKARENGTKIISEEQFYAMLLRSDP